MPFINGIGPGELIIILIIALIVVGPGKLPDVGSALGKSIREFRKAATDVKESVSLDPAPTPTPPASAGQAPAATPAQVTAPPVPVVAPPVVPGAAAIVGAPSAAGEAPVVATAAAPAAAEAPAEPESWPAEVTPVDEQQPTASA